MSEIKYSRMSDSMDSKIELNIDKTQVYTYSIIYFWKIYTNLTIKLRIESRLDLVYILKIK